MKHESFIKKKLEKEEIFLDETFYRCCDIFIQNLLLYSKTHNITRLKTPLSIEENIIDSIYPIKFLPDIKSILDIGTGAGFPGLVLSFAMRDSKIYLIEPISKRTAFLHLIKTKCNLKNVTIINKRVEDTQNFKVDLITSRAVTDTKVLIKLSTPFYKKNTLFLFYKGADVKKEIPLGIEYKLFNRDKRKYLLMNI